MYLLTLLLPVFGGLTSAVLQKRSPAAWPVPWMSIITAALVAGMLALQLHLPILLQMFARRPSLIDGGEIWRAGTALFVQDGGLAGGLFNLVLLLVIGPLAESRLGPMRWAVSYFAGGVVTEVLALAWQPQGAGNSIACFALAGSLVVTCLIRTRDWRAAVVAGLGLMGMAALLALHDIHGIGYLVGALLGAILAWRDRCLAVRALSSAADRVRVTL